MALTISVISDVVCPWCYVGKRRLERALDELRLRDGASVEWLPFELNPDMPEEGIPREIYRARKFGAERSAELDTAMTETGRQEGIAFAFDRQAMTPNSRRAHVLVACATQAGRADEVVDALFRAYFEEGRDVGDESVLLEIATKAGLPRELTGAALADPDLRASVEAAEQEAVRVGVSGVPFFIVDGRWAMSGAQPTEAWIEALSERLRSEPDAA